MDRLVYGMGCPMERLLYSFKLALHYVSNSYRYSGMESHHNAREVGKHEVASNL